MRLLSRILLVTVFCFIAVAFLPARAQTVCLPYGIDLTPKNGPPGTEAIVSGYGFATDKLVEIYYDGALEVAGRTDSSGNFALRFRVPEGSTGPYQVLAWVGADWGTVEVHTYFTVRPGLTVEPEAGPAGKTVTVTGLGFAAYEPGIELMYYVDGGYDTVGRSTADANGSWQIEFPVPASARGEHKLDAQGTISKLFEVGDTVFRVTAEIRSDETSGFGGGIITITGAKFSPYEDGIEILFDGEPVATDPGDIKADGGGNWEASFQVPDMPAGEYSITARGKRTSSDDVGELGFEVRPEFILSHDQGHVGMELTVTGRGFPASEHIIILYDDNQVAIAETDEQGTFEASFWVPSSEHGVHQVRAKLTEGTNNTADLEIDASATFTMESTAPPVPEQISPADGNRLGLFGAVTPTFEWSGVSDESGVAYYRLQIATSPDFTTSSVVLPATIVNGTSYTLKDTEALSLGTYYWIVQAVDGAENESGWSVNHSFRVGLLPLWGFIAAIVAAAVLLILLIRALLRRRSIYYDGW